MKAVWGERVRLAQLARGPVRLELEPDAAVQAKIARDLGLEGLSGLKAQVTIRPWLDGAELVGRFEARVTQVCGVSLDAFEQDLRGDIAVALVSAGSPNAATPEGGEVELDPDAPDPPDVLDTDEIDVSAYVVEHLALEIDPFPRKPGATFDYVPQTPEEGPFAALRKLKKDG